MSEVADRKRAGLMQAAIRVIAEDGLENTSVKDICRVSDINVAYVYRYFDNKEDLIAKTFAREDQGLLNGILNDFMLLRFNSIDYEMRCRLVFTKCWEYLMARPQELIFYVRYYYSYSFQQYSYADHIERYAGLVEKMRPAFPRIRGCAHAAPLYSGYDSDPGGETGPGSAGQQSGMWRALLCHDLQRGQGLCQAGDAGKINGFADGRAVRKKRTALFLFCLPLPPQSVIMVILYFVNRHLPFPI